MTGAFGPRYIASRVGYAIAGHAAVDAFANDRGRKDAVVLACFGDPGLAALKEIAKVPVVGMADASILQACAMGNRFSIVTGGERWQSMLEEFVARHGLSSRLASIRTVAPTGADIARNPKAAMALLAKGCTACVREDGADVVILGGAGLAGLAAKLKDAVDAPLLDGVACAISMAEALAKQKPAKAKSGALAAAGARRECRSVAGVGEADRIKERPLAALGVTEGVERKAACHPERSEGPFRICACN